MKNPDENTDEINDKGVNTKLKILNKTPYNKITLYQEYTVCFKISEEEKTKANKYGYARRAWVKLLIILSQP